uniref:DNAdirected RNA polymerase III subunit RPC5like protein putative n=1 Tax=Albugo laibachii Nc14 TaxID=890382 RepID=F0WMY9_9STRA|nr:DNAdirected RNA polymerase III subunit RPC5like protein putative [Albugo laibachii Nc14]|eukprot:CCA22676.1 DNAdirected RNA polymerase III subunit RPC5like protein putative [Albugo laibachii Nc14]
MEENDPIIAEIPVHLVETQRGKLHLIQYPLRPSYRPMPTIPQKARFKPQNRILELDYDARLSTQNYDRDAEEYLQQRYLRLQSSQVVEQSNYAIGMIRQGQLHLTPVHSVLQMRPSLLHIDEALEEERSEEEKETIDESQVKEVQFEFKKKHNERSMKALQNSYQHKKQQINAERWKELTIFEQSNEHTLDEFEGFFSEREEKIVSELSSSEYLETLKYRNANAKVDEKPMGSIQTPSTLSHKLLQALKTDYISTFSRLCAIFVEESANEIARALVDVAVAVRGRLFPKCFDEKSRIRNILLRNFVRNRAISRAEMDEKYNLDALEAKECLQEIATLDPITRLWSLKLERDDTLFMEFEDISRKLEDIAL